MVKCTYLSLLQICQTIRVELLFIIIVQQLVLFIPKHLDLLNKYAHNAVLSRNEREILFVNELNKLVHVVCERIEQTGTSRS